MRSLPSYVLDTSVAVKWFADEGGLEQAKAVHVFEAFAKGHCELRAPELLYFEIANALKHSCKLSSSTIIDSLDSLQRLNIEVESLNWPTLRKAVEIATTCGAAIYDSYFLAVAMVSDSVLITADHAFLRKARHMPNIMDLRLFDFPERTS